MNLQALRADGQGRLHRRPHRHAGDARPDPRGHRPLMASIRARVAALRHGSRVPGWDEAADLTKDPAVVPDPATTPVPDELRARDRGATWRKYPDRRSAAIPALHAVQRALRLVLAGGDRAGGVRDAPDARLPRRGRDLLRHARHRSPSAATTSTSARTSRARCAAPTSSSRRFARARRRRPRLQRARVRVPRRVRHRADGLGRRRLRRPARARRGARRSSRPSAAARSRCPTRQLSSRKSADPNAAA